jgi:hypothetical protein
MQYHFLFVDFNMVSLTVIIIVTFAVAAYGHECKDFKLSASDQSVIDMMNTENILYMFEYNLKQDVFCF